MKIESSKPHITIEVTKRQRLQIYNFRDLLGNIQLPEHPAEGGDEASDGETAGLAKHLAEAVSKAVVEGLKGMKIRSKNAQRSPLSKKE